MNEVISTQLAGPTNDLSIISLFMQADIVVKIVIIGLLIASVWCWAIIIEKYILFKSTNKKADNFETIFWSGKPLEDLYQNFSQSENHSLSSLFVAAMREWKRSFDMGSNSTPDNIQKRIEKVMDITISREVARLERGLLFLATVGSTAPFVGLFGTVWGIMNSFQSIASSKSTNLAVVAPGIAEALFATALGLLAAIPAVVFYNKLSADMSRIELKLESFADEFMAIISRQLDG